MQRQEVVWLNPATRAKGAGQLRLPTMAGR